MHHVYRNLHKARWSVKNKETKRVTMHRKQLVLRDCIFWVSQNGRAKVQKEKQKNVHAMVRGSICQEKLPTDLKGWVQVSYDPYRKDVDRFYIKKTGKPIDQARKVIFTPDMKVYALI